MNKKSKSEINWTLIISILLISIVGLIGISQINSILEEQNLEKENELWNKELEIKEIEAQAELARQDKEKDLARIKLINAEKERKERKERNARAEKERKERNARAEKEKQLASLRNKRAEAEANKIKDWLSLRCVSERFNHKYNTANAPKYLFFIFRKSDRDTKPTILEYTDYLSPNYPTLKVKAFNYQSITKTGDYLKFRVDYQGWYEIIGGDRYDLNLNMTLNIKNLKFTHIKNSAGSGPTGAGSCIKVPASYIRNLVK
mgnify:CR=1 FL=1